MVTIDSLLARQDKIAVVGLGYVGLPLAIQLSAHFDVVGYDCNSNRVKEISAGLDRTLEASKEELQRANIRCTNDPKLLSECRLIIIAVPTPIDSHKIPELSPLKGASAATGQNLSRGSCVVYESTVYPGVTEEYCLPILEKESGLKLGSDFSIGYSPERINPGDKVHTLANVVKIVSGSDSATLNLLASVYGKVVKAGVHQASSIKVAEAAKVIENTQRDLNIALMNELAMIFDKMGIDTQEVLAAAGTKWNFLRFAPGLVGGHCIGVDPYYLTFKAEHLGYHPEIILAGRRINDSMGKYVAERTVKLLIAGGRPVRGGKVAILGLAFKEDVPDLRNTRVIDIVKELETYGVEAVVHDPMADPAEAESYYGIKLQSFDELHGAEAVIVAVVHKAITNHGLLKIASICNNSHPIVVDIKGAFSKEEAQKHNIRYWRL